MTAITRSNVLKGPVLSSVAVAAATIFAQVLIATALFIVIFAIASMSSHASVAQVVALIDDPLEYVMTSMSNIAGLRNLLFAILLLPHFLIGLGAAALGVRVVRRFVTGYVGYIVLVATAVITALFEVVVFDGLSIHFAINLADDVAFLLGVFWFYRSEGLTQPR